MPQFEQLAAAARERISQCADSRALEAVRVEYLGRKGVVTGHLKSLGRLPHEERVANGKILNRVKDEINLAVEERRRELDAAGIQARLSSEQIDVSAPGKKQELGCRHPVMQVMERVAELFCRVGFEIREGPEVEDDFHNFEALNIPPHHPARAMHDTFYLGDDLLLRTHTSPVQIRVMQSTPPPVRIVVPGRVYRRDFDPTHSPMFHQLEGLVVDEAHKVSFAGLKGVVNAFLREFFEDSGVAIRFRPSYFPFTEPSAEVDIRRAGGGWLEVMGCGMVHPNVLRAVELDADRYAGYAFGLGIERLAMLKYGVDDLRTFFDNHLGFVSQFHE